MPDLDGKLSLKGYRTDEEYLIRLIGTLTLRNSQWLDEQLRSLLKESLGKIYFSLRELEYVDSAGLGFFVSFNSRARSSSKEFILLQPNASLVRLFKLSRIDLILNVAYGAEAESIAKRIELEENEFDTEPSS